VSYLFHLLSPARAGVISDDKRNKKPAFSLQIIIFSLMSHLLFRSNLNFFKKLLSTCEQITSSQNENFITVYIEFYWYYNLLRYHWMLLIFNGVSELLRYYLELHKFYN